MKNDLLYYGISFILPPLVVLFFQLIFNRLKKGSSPQLLTMVSIVVGYPLFFLIIFILPFQYPKNLDFILYMFLLYSFSAYSYFHIFNMSETSRRVRMLTAISLRNLHGIQELENIYDENQMIQTRLDRLVALGQIKEIQKRYYPRGYLFVLVAKVLYGLSCLFGRPWQALKKDEAIGRKETD